MTVRLTLLLSAALGLLSACDQTPDSVDAAGALVAANMEPLPFEGIGKIETLEGKYESDWFFAHDANFNSLTAGKVMLIDAGGSEMDYRGAIDAGQFASFVQAPVRGELYVAETYYSRGTKGTRTDIVTIYDRDSFKKVDEVVLPKNNRAMQVPQKAALQLTGNGKFLLVYTFTPATGVAVIDLDSRRIVNEIDTSGCILAYPAGQQGFASMCGNGTMASFMLDSRGEIASRFESAAFNDIDANPLFTMSTRVGDTVYYPTFEGHLQGVVLGDAAPKPLATWHFAEGTDRKPSGWQMITGDKQGRVYVLMRANAKPGDHKSGGSEVWVLDPVKREILRKIELVEESISIEASHSDKPVMLATNASMAMDVYDLSNDSKLRTIGGFVAAMPMVLHAAERAK